MLRWGIKTFCNIPYSVRCFSIAAVFTVYALHTIRVNNLNKLYNWKCKVLLKNGVNIGFKVAKIRKRLKCKENLLPYLTFNIHIVSTRLVLVEIIDIILLTFQRQDNSNQSILDKPKNP